MMPCYHDPAKNLCISNATEIALIRNVTGVEPLQDFGVEPEAVKYLKVCVPIVVFFAPFGSILSSHFHRQVLATLIYVLDTVALVTAFAVLTMDWKLYYFE